MSPTVDGHRRGRTESRAYQQRACDGKGASGRPSTRKGRVESVYQRRACDGKAAKGAADAHRRRRAESRAYQRRAYDGKAAKGAADGHRRGKAESRAYISVERAMGRQRREQRTPIDEEGPSPERISGERTMGRRRREQRTAIDGYLLCASVHGRRLVPAPPAKKEKPPRKIRRTYRRWPCAVLRPFAQRREKVHGVLKFNATTSRSILHSLYMWRVDL